LNLTSKSRAVEEKGDGIRKRKGMEKWEKRKRKTLV
jgi:hypothetical protein